MALHANPCQLLQITITDTTVSLSATSAFFTSSSSSSSIQPVIHLLHAICFNATAAISSFSLNISLPSPSLIRLLFSSLSHLTFHTYFSSQLYAYKYVLSVSVPSKLPLRRKKDWLCNQILGLNGHGSKISKIGQSRSFLWAVLRNAWHNNPESVCWNGPGKICIILRGE